MTTRKKTNRRVRKTSRGHQQSISGKILPPLDVRSSTSLNEFKKRILSGPITIVMVYADWCGHCHEMRPHFDAAAKSSNRSMQAITVNETMLDKVNESINNSINHNAKPIEVEGYPSILLVDNQGNKVSDINAVKDTNVMTKVMSEPVSNTSNASSKKVNNAKEGAVNGEGLISNEVQNNVLNSYVGEDKLLGSVASIKPNNKSNLKMNKGAIIPVSPSNVNHDLISNEKKQGVVGGSLYGAIAQSAYTLAPAAILLATAATMMNRHKKGTRKVKRVLRSAKGKKKSASRRRV